MASPRHLLFLYLFLSLAIISSSDPAAAPSQSTTSASPAKTPPPTQPTPATAKPAANEPAHATTPNAPAGPKSPVGNAQPSSLRGPAMIEQTCKQTSHPELCVHALSAVPLAHRSDQRQLAAIALRLAYQNGTETAGYITGLMDQVGETEPNTQQCLIDCSEHYELALDELDDASAALDDMVTDEQANKHALMWIETAMSNIKNCQEGCKEGADHKNVLTKKNGAINKLCSITISIIKIIG